MKGFALDESGDVLIQNGKIDMVNGVELTKQTIKTVLGTQKGEWFLDWDEGINHDTILGKKRYANQNNSKDIRQEQEYNELDEMLAKRLDGVT